MTARPSIRAIDVDRAKQLYKVLGSWKLVGETLANEELRPIKFHGRSVRTAIRNAEQHRKTK